MDCRSSRHSNTRGSRMTRVGFGWFVIGAGSRRMYTTRRLNGASRIESLSALPLRSLRLRGFSGLVSINAETQRTRRKRRETSLEESIVTFNCPVKQNILNACAGSNVVYDQTFALRLG